MSLIKTTQGAVASPAIRLLAIVWLLLLLVLLILQPPLHQPRVLSPGWLLLMAWSVLTLGILAYVLFYAPMSLRRHRVAATRGERIRVDEVHKTLASRRTVLLGVSAGLLVALPAVGFTILGFVIAVPFFTASLSEEGNRVALAPTAEIAGGLAQQDSEPFAYVVAVDLSKSNVRSLNDDRLEDICDFVETLFAAEPHGSQLNVIKYGDLHWSYAFAGRTLMLESPPETFFSSPRSPGAFCDTVRKLLRSSDVDAVVDLDKTDIVGFLDYVIGYLQRRGVEHRFITVILLSDFRQDVAGFHDDSRNLLRGIMRRVANMGNVQLVGVTTAETARGDASVGTDIRPYLDRYGVDDHGDRKLWRVFSLAEFTSASPEARKAKLYFNLYREVVTPQPLYLKYLVDPDRHNLPSHLRIPPGEDYHYLFLGLQGAKEDAEQLENLQVAFGDPDRSPFVLRVGAREGDFEIYHNERTAPEDLPVTLFRRLDVTRAIECDLLVAVPARTEIHTVRLVILPSVGKLPMFIFHIILWFLVAVLAILLAGVIDWRARRWRWLRRMVRRLRLTRWHP